MSPDARVYYAHKSERSGVPRYYHASPSRKWLSYFYSSMPIVTLRLRERKESDPPSAYWGWVDAKKPDKYTMVWPTRTQFVSCFQYSPELSEQVGNGRAVNLIAEEFTE